MNVKLDQHGLVPAVVQDIDTKQVLMLGYVDQESLKRSLDEGQVWFYSRSRKELWHKGEVSGNYMNLKASWVDCDGDTVLFQVEPEGPTCHTGNVSCFFTSMEGQPEYQQPESGSGILDELFAVIQERQRNPPKDSYTVELLQAGKGRVAQKVIEEAGESAIAAVEGDAEQVTREVADLFYHAMVLLVAAGASPETVWRELSKRRR